MNISLRTRRCLSLLLFLSLPLATVGVKAQRTRTTAKKRPAPTTPAKTQPPKTQPQKAQARPPKPEPSRSLDTSGLKAGDFYRYVHDGRFTRFENDLRFKMTFETYVTTYSEMCKPHLSKQSEEITRHVETYRTETTYLWGGRGFPLPITNQRLESVREVGTGYFAEPEFAAEYKKLTGGYMREFLRRVDGTSPKAILEGVLKTVGDAVEMAIETRFDMSTMLSNNGCTSPATKRFSGNLLRYAHGRQSLQAENGEKSFFDRECEAKLPRLFPKSSPGACPCIYRELSAAMPAELYQSLEDNFDAHDFKVFMLMSVYRAGLQQKISACIRRR